MTFLVFEMEDGTREWEIDLTGAEASPDDFTENGVTWTYVEPPRWVTSYYGWILGVM